MKRKRHCGQYSIHLNVWNKCIPEQVHFWSWCTLWSSAALCNNKLFWNTTTTPVDDSVSIGGTVHRCCSAATCVDFSLLCTACPPLPHWKGKWREPDTCCDTDSLSVSFGWHDIRTIYANGCFASLLTVTMVRCNVLLIHRQNVFNWVGNCVIVFHLSDLHIVVQHVQWPHVFVVVFFLV